MGKILFWAAVIIIGLFVMRLLARHTSAKPRVKKPPRSGSRRLERMVQCAHCGVHLPEQDAINRDGHNWCSAAHARQGLPR